MDGEGSPGPSSHLTVLYLWSLGPAQQAASLQQDTEQSPGLGLKGALGDVHWKTVFSLAWLELFVT